MSSLCGQSFLNNSLFVTSLNKDFGLIFEKVGNSFYFNLPNGGTFQMNNNRVIIFVD